MTQYGSQAYWEERYQKDPEQFDWYQRWAGLREILAQYIRKSDNILMVGCGNSRLSEEMSDDGFAAITNIDISKTVIDAMVTRCKERAGLTWKVMNVCQLAYQDGTFDAVIDKGTTDSLLCGENSTSNVAKMCSEISRVLKPGGNFVVVSYGTPETRLSYLEHEDYRWRVTVNTIPKPSITGASSAAPDASAADAVAVHYVYVCHKAS